MRVSDAEFVVLDVETTGLEPDWGHRVCEVGLVVWRDGVEIDRFWSLVNPGRSIDTAAALVNRLSEVDLRSAPPMSDVLLPLEERISGRVLVAYNASFDVGFLRNEYRLAGRPLPPFRAIDVMALARRLMPELGRYPLPRVVGALGIPFPTQHRAMADAEATSAVFHAFLDRLSREGVTTLDELETIARSTSPAGETLRREKIAVILRAIDEGSCLHLVYRARDDSLTERDVTPRTMRTWAGSAQLVGFCHLRGAERTFSIDLIQDVRITDPPSGNLSPRPA